MVAVVGGVGRGEGSFGVLYDRGIRARGLEFGRVAAVVEVLYYGVDGVGGFARIGVVGVVARGRRGY